MYVCMYVCECVRARGCVCVCVCMYASMYVCMYVFSGMTERFEEYPKLKELIRLKVLNIHSNHHSYMCLLMN